MNLEWISPTVTQHDHYLALEPVTTFFRAAGMYAYRTLDDENRWCVALDLEEGHIDVRIGQDGYELDVWATSPGMFVDQDNERRQIALERLARISIPAFRRGYLEEHQRLEWNDNERGVSLRTQYTMPFSAGERLPDIAMRELDELNNTLRFIERKLVE